MCSSSLEGSLGSATAGVAGEEEDGFAADVEVGVVVPVVFGCDDAVSGEDDAGGGEGDCGVGEGGVDDVILAGGEGGWTCRGR